MGVGLAGCCAPSCWTVLAVFLIQRQPGDAVSAARYISRLLLRYSETTTWIAADIGIESSAPNTPIYCVPARIATKTVSGESPTAPLITRRNTSEFCTQ